MVLWCLTGFIMFRNERCWRSRWGLIKASKCIRSWCGWMWSLWCFTDDIFILLISTIYQGFYAMLAKSRCAPWAVQQVLNRYYVCCPNVQQMPCLQLDSFRLLWFLHDRDNIKITGWFISFPHIVSGIQAGNLLLLCTVVCMPIWIHIWTNHIHLVKVNCKTWCDMRFRLHLF